MQPSPRHGARPLNGLSSLKYRLDRYLPIMALALLATASGRCAQQPGPKLTVAEQYLLAAANLERANHGLRPVRLDSTLTQASAFHARQMAEHEDISHRFDKEPELAERGADAGARFSLITENVGEAPTSVIIHNLWMQSPGHRANLLDPDVDAIGVAVIMRGGELYAVEDFANTVETLSFAEQEHTVANLITQAGVEIADATEDARQTCAMSTGYAGSRQPRYIVRYTAASLDQIPNQLKGRLSSGKYHQAVVGACTVDRKSSFTAYNIAVLLYP